MPDHPTPAGPPFSEADATRADLAAQDYAVRFLGADEQIWEKDLAVYRRARANGKAAAVQAAVLLLQRRDPALRGEGPVRAVRWDGDILRGTNLDAVRLIVPEARSVPRPHGAHLVIGGRCAVTGQWVLVENGVPGIWDDEAAYRDFAPLMPGEADG